MVQLVGVGNDLAVFRQREKGMILHGVTTVVPHYVGLNTGHQIPQQEGEPNTEKRLTRWGLGVVAQTHKVEDHASLFKVAA